MVRVTNPSSTSTRVSISALRVEPRECSSPVLTIGIVGVTLIGILLTTTACGDGSARTSVPEPDRTTIPAATPLSPTPVAFFPQQAPEPQRDAANAYISGKLVEVDGCLRVVTGSSGTSYLILWPPDVSLDTESGTTRVLDKADQVVVQVGDEVFISGGEIPTSSSSWLSKQLREPLPDACPGPYWLTGFELRRNQQR